MSAVRTGESQREAGTVHERRYQEPVDLRLAWDSHAEEWARWARTPGHDSYEHFHRDRFLDLLPSAGQLTVDLGCGEGRLGRDLMARGHRVVGVEGSPTLASLAATADPPQPTAVADAAALPMRACVADLAVAMLSLQDMNDLDGAVREAARVLVTGGRFCFAIVHPMNSAGEFTSSEPDSPWVMTGDYFEVRLYADDIQRDGIPMTFVSMHRPLEVISRALEDAGFLVERLREVSPRDRPTRWSRLPGFLDVRAVKS